MKNYFQTNESVEFQERTFECRRWIHWKVIQLLIKSMHAVCNVIPVLSRSTIQHKKYKKKAKSKLFPVLVTLIGIFIEFTFTFISIFWYLLINMNDHQHTIAISSHSNNQIFRSHFFHFTIALCCSAILMKNWKKRNSPFTLVQRVQLTCSTARTSNKTHHCHCLDER